MHNKEIGDNMEINMHKELLNEYENKRRFAIRQAEEKKSSFLLKYPDFAKLEEELSMASISYSRSLITKPEDKDVFLKQIKQKITDIQNKKLSFLQQLGLDFSYFEPIYECKLCKDTGYFQQDNKSIMCSCLKQRIYNIEYNKSNIGNLENENFSTFSFDNYSDEVNSEKYHASISPRENIRNIKSICEHFIEHFDNPDERNLLFIGNTGLGKTFLSNCIAYELLKQGKTVLYQTAPVMLDEIIDYRFNKPNCNFSIIENLLTVDLLIIDDLGTETMNNMKFTELFNIINSRLLNQNHKITKTIISTNLSLKNIFDNYEERLGSRFVGHYHICRFFGDDIRFNQVKAK